MKLIATYSRVSTSLQEEQQTIKNQLNSLEEYAKKNDYTIVKQYTDEGWSGDILARPSLDNLRNDAKKKLWEAVLIYDPDRLARRYSYQELVMDELREAGIEVIFVTVASPKNSEDKILHGVRGLFAEYERAKISERFRLGKIRKVKEGHILTTEALYGYRYIKKQEKVHGYYEIDPEEARVVKMIFSWVGDEKLTIRMIVRRLQELGINPRRSKRGHWATSTLTTMLRHKGYIGEAHWGSSYAVVPLNPRNKDMYKKMKKTSRRNRPEEEWYTIPIPAIIEKELFMRVKFQLEESYKLAKRNTKNEYLLSGKIYCGCGKKRTGEARNHGKHFYYRCIDRILSFPMEQTCTEKTINAKITDTLVWEKVAELMSSPELLLEQINRWISSQRTKTTFTYSDVEAIEKEVVILKKQEDRYNEAYGAGLFTLEKLKEYIIPIKEKIALFESQIEKSREEQKQQNTLKVPTTEEIKVFAQKSLETLKNLSFEIKKSIIVSVVEKVVSTEQELQVYGYIPILNQDVALCSNHRHGLNTIGFNFTQKGYPFRLNIKLPPPLKTGVDYGFRPLNTYRAPNGTDIK